MSRTRFLLMLFVCGVLATTFVAFHPAAQEVDEGASSDVSESELEMYIAVYTAMQDNHDLLLEDAIKPYHLSLEQFRELERRIQSQPRLVERVREALLEDRRKHSALLGPESTPPPQITPPVLLQTPHARPHPHKKKK